MFSSSWFTSFCMTISRSVQVSANGPISFLLMVEQYSIIYGYHILFIPSSVDVYLGCFHVLAIVNSAAMSACIFLNYSFLWAYPGVGFLGHVAALFSVFCRTSILFCRVAVPVYNPTNNVRVPFSIYPLLFVVCRTFDDGHSDQYEEMLHYSFALHFSSNKWCWAFFHVLFSHLYVFFAKMSI